LVLGLSRRRPRLESAVTIGRDRSKTGPRARAAKEELVKSQDKQKGEEKKKAQKSLKEKRAEKKAKKDSKSTSAD
jgi:hypothetical protein